MLKFNSTFINCATLFLLGIVVTPIAYATPWIFTSIGTIYSGTDYTGVFGTANTDLSGKSYSEVFILDPSLYSSQFPNSYFNSASGSLFGSATVTVTVNGMSQTYAYDLSKYNDGQSYLNNGLAQFGGVPYIDSVRQYEYGYTADDQSIAAESQVFNLQNILNVGLNFDQVWSYNIQSGDGADAYFYTSGIDGRANFNGTPNFLSINVPEPATLALMGLGLLGVVTVRRRKDYLV